MQEPTWTIRVGGVYHFNKHPEITAEVVAIGGGIVHFHCWFKGETHPYRSDWCFIDSFRKLYLPEEASPIPDLVAALEAALQILQRSPDICTNDSGNFRTVSTGSAIAEARSAVAKARAGAYCG